MVRSMASGLLTVACCVLVTGSASGQAAAGASGASGADQDSFEAIWERFVANGWTSVQTLGPKLDEALKDYGMAVCDVERVSLPPGSPAHIFVSLDVNRRGFYNSVLRITTVGR